MKNIFTIFLILSFNTAFGVECTLDKNSGKTLVKFQTIEDLADEEESLEENAVDIDSIQVSVSYLPYQEGIYLHIYDNKNNEIASGSNHESVTIKLQNSGNKYTINCKAE